jgi:transposase
LTWRLWSTPAKGSRWSSAVGKVERTLARLLNDRRHSRDYKRLTVNSEAMIQISMIQLLLKRLA